MKSNIKEDVKAFYGEIAKNVKDDSKASCGCGTSCCGDATVGSSIYVEDFLSDIPESAINASLGCANPMTMETLKEGDVVLDLGSGGGIDVFIASKYVGESGMVYGLDMTDEMLALARENKSKMGVKNVEFIKGYIEDIPLEDGKVDVILSNCVINLCESKEDALREAYRVLKDNGRLAIADIVVLKDIPEDIKRSAELWVGCIAGALLLEEYEGILKKVGFKEVEISPIHIYTKAFIESIAKEKGMEEMIKEIDLELLDGAFCGANIKAYK